MKLANLAILAVASLAAIAVQANASDPTHPETLPPGIAATLGIRG